MAGTVHYQIKCDKLVINNGACDDKDREIEKLRAENCSLKDQLSQRITADGSGSNGTTDCNITYRTYPESHNSHLQSQPLTNRFHRNNLNRVSQTHSIYEIGRNDTDQTDQKLTYPPSSRAARAERPYDDADLIYHVYPDLGDYYMNVPSKTTKVPKKSTDNNNRQLERANGTKQNECYVETPSGSRYLRPVRIPYNREPLPPSLPERNRNIHKLKKSYPNREIGPEAAALQYDENDEQGLYGIYSCLKPTIETSNAERTHNPANQAPIVCQAKSYTKVVDESYLTKNKPNLHTDLANNCEKLGTGNKNERSKILFTYNL